MQKTKSQKLIFDVTQYYHHIHVLAMFGALQRATTWNGARVFIITSDQEANSPDWLSVPTLRVEIMPQSYLCDCHNIQVMIDKKAFIAMHF